MGQLEVADRNAAADTKGVSSAYVPPLQRTQGQPPPIAANGGLSYLSFDRNGDAGPGKALDDALATIAEGESQRVGSTLIRNAPSRASITETRWGPRVPPATTSAFEPTSARTGSKAPTAARRCCPALYGLRAADLLRRHVQRALWRDPAARRNGGDPAPEREGGQPCAGTSYVLQVLQRRAAHRRGPTRAFSPESPECMDRLGVLAGAPRSPRARTFYDSGGGGARLLPRDREAPPRVLPGVQTDALVYNHDVFDKDYTGDPHGRPGQQETRASTPATPTSCTTT